MKQIHPCRYSVAYIWLDNPSRFSKLNKKMLFSSSKAIRFIFEGTVHLKNKQKNIMVIYSTKVTFQTHLIVYNIASE